MAIRDKQPDADAGRKIVDEQLENLEARLTSMYGNAAKEMTIDLNKFLEKYYEKDKEKKAEIDSITDADERKQAEKEYEDWKDRQIFRTRAMQAKIDDLTARAVNADKQAMAMVNDQLPETYATSYNFGGFRGETYANAAGFDYTQFTIINQEAVRTLVKDDPDLIPWKPVPDIEEDKKWNRKHIQEAIQQGIVKGDSMDKVAERLLPVVNMDKNAAIRTARTAVNGIENKGRKDATERVKKAGIPMVEMWSCTHDSRTRDTHILLDRTLPNEKGLFGEGIISKLLEYPADPAGDPEEIYNCRCGLSSFIEGIDHSKDDELYAQMMQEEYYEDWLKVKASTDEKEAAFQVKKEGAAERVAEKRAREEAKNDDTLGEKTTLTKEEAEKYEKTSDYAFELANMNADLEHPVYKIEYNGNQAFVDVSERKDELYIEGMASTGGGAGTEIFTRVAEKALDEDKDLSWSADQQSAIDYYNHLGLKEYGEETSFGVEYTIPNDRLEEVIDHLRGRDEELPKESELLSTDNDLKILNEAKSQFDLFEVMDDIGFEKLEEAREEAGFESNYEFFKAYINGDIESKTLDEALLNSELFSNYKNSEKSENTFEIATNRKEATELLKNLGFSDISKGVEYLNEKIYVASANKISELNARFNAIKVGKTEPKITTESEKAVASVHQKFGEAGSISLNFNPNFFAMSDRKFEERIENQINIGFYMPCASENYLVEIVTHEYGHLVENMLLNTPEFTEEYLNSTKPITWWRERYENMADNIKEEIIDIAYEENPDFDLEKNMGEYAGKNSMEFFAECFMNSQLGEPNELGNAMNIWLEREGL